MCWMAQQRLLSPPCRRGARPPRRLHRLVLAAAVSAAVLTSAAAAAPSGPSPRRIYVSPAVSAASASASATAECGGLHSPCATIQAAVRVADAAPRAVHVNVVLLGGRGTFSGPGNCGVAVTRSLTVSGGPGGPAVIDCQWRSRAFVVSPHAAFALQDVHVRAGFADSTSVGGPVGGAVLVTEVPTTATDLAARSTVGAPPAGVSLVRVTVRDSVVRVRGARANATVYGGGAVYVALSGACPRVLLDSCTFVNNSVVSAWAGFGGGGAVAFVTAAGQNALQSVTVAVSNTTMTGNACNGAGCCGGGRTCVVLCVVLCCVVLCGGAHCAAPPPASARRQHRHLPA